LLQIDTIDMRHQADGEWKYIAHYVDHYSKFHVLWPLMNKTAAEVAIGFRFVVHEQLCILHVVVSTSTVDNITEINKYQSQICKKLFDMWCEYGFIID
jgi:hypothetical protein